MNTRPLLSHTARRLAFLALIVFAVFRPLLEPTPAKAESRENLPWEADYATALAKARAENRPLFLMLTATWCGPCKVLERQTLTTPAVRAGLNEFVWVQAFEDKTLDKKFGASGYPTLVFLDPSTEKVIGRSSGAEPPNVFLAHVIQARKSAGLPLSNEMKELSKLAFEPDPRRMRALENAGDLGGLVEYLAPARQDRLRAENFVIVKVRAPEGISPGEIVGAIGRRELNLSEGGLAIARAEVKQSSVELKIVAPGCKVISERLLFEDGAAILSREIQLERLSKNDAAGFAGRVLLPDGRPAAHAIVRIVDWTATKTDAEGRFRIEGISPGSFLVRGEAPGGEFHEEVNFAVGKELNQDIPLKAVTTVGIRWALQTKEGIRSLVGEGVRTGEAYFSPAHSRFALDRGVGIGSWGSDLMLANWDDGSARRQYVDPKVAAEADAAAPGTPIFWLFDATHRKTGLHRETAGFEDITEVRATSVSEGTRHFEFLRGTPVRKDDVFTVWCVRRDCYAKLQITDVTVVSN
jgi:thiol-disulfide isomerase/thioredoxin